MITKCSKHEIQGIAEIPTEIFYEKNEKKKSLTEEKKGNEEISTGN